MEKFQNKFEIDTWEFVQIVSKFESKAIKWK